MVRQGPHILQQNRLPVGDGTSQSKHVSYWRKRCACQTRSPAKKVVTLLGSYSQPSQKKGTAGNTAVSLGSSPRTISCMLREPPTIRAPFEFGSLRFLFKRKRRPWAAAFQLPRIILGEAEDSQLPLPLGGSSLGMPCSLSTISPKRGSSF